MQSRLTFLASDEAVSVPDENTKRVPPWIERPFQLVGWWEMIEFSAPMFFWCGKALRGIRNDCIVGSFPVEHDEPIFQMFKPLDDKCREKALKELKLVAEEFHKLGMRITAETVEELLKSLEAPSSLQNFQWLIQRIDGIETLAVKEMKGTAFFYVPPERARFFPLIKAPHLFGSKVNDAFPSAFYDIVESGFCLGLARGGACVFHLMRILEIGLSALGAKFGVSLAHTNWAPAIEQIESKIRDLHKDPAWKALPDCKEQQEFYAQVASHFAILKDAWRNYTMHARAKYTEEEAVRIFDNTKAFMQKLADGGLKE